LKERGLSLEQQVIIPVVYKSIQFDQGFRSDIIIEKKVIIELKSIELVNASHRKQLQTYLKLTGCKLGYILNFGAPLMKDGIVRVVNNLE
jgi:GxxExxY protein